MEREPWLLVQEGSKLYLMARIQQDFVFITVNNALTADKEEQLARSGSFSGLRLQELGLTFRVLPGNQVRGVALTGCEAGETLYFYPASGKKQKYIFSDDYEKAQIDAFFTGVERFTPPGNKKKKKDPDAWRLEGRDPQLYKKLWFVCPALIGLNIGGGIGYLANRSWPWYLASLLCAAVPVALNILFPAYFSLVPEKRRKVPTHDLALPLAVHMLSVMLPMGNWLNEWMYLMVGIACGLAAVILMGTLAMEFKKNRAYLFVLFIAAGLCGIPEVQQINQVFDFSEPRVYTLSVEDLEHTGGSDSSYRCFITLPDGQEAGLHIGAQFYTTLEVGDPIRVEVSTGALGIEYASVYPME